VTDEAFGPALRRLRREQGLSLRKLQALVQYDFTYLGQVERGEKPGSPELAAVCDAALNTSGDLASVYLRSSAAPIVGLQDAAPDSAVDDHIDHIESKVATLQNAYHAARSPDGLLNLTRGHLDSVTELLRDEASDENRSRLQRTRSVVASLGGRLAFFDLNDPLTARAYHTVAYEAAIQAADDALAAMALGHLAFPPAKEGDSAAAVAYLSEAMAHARRAGVPLVTSWLSAVESEVVCEIDPTAALRALDHAQLSLDHAEDDETPAWFDYYSPARLAGFRGHTLLKVGYPDQAREALEVALAGVEHCAVKQRALLRADVAAAWLVAGHRDVDRACELAAESAADLATAGYATAVERLRELRDQLAPWERSHAVRQLDDVLSVLPSFSASPPQNASTSS
jgi:transcriptional regulator with XRE-family HTH domain